MLRASTRVALYETLTFQKMRLVTLVMFMSIVKLVHSCTVSVGGLRETVVVDPPPFAQRTLRDDEHRMNKMSTARALFILLSLRKTEGRNLISYDGVFFYSRDDQVHRHRLTRPA